MEPYLSALPDERREAIEAVRRTILDNLPHGMEEAVEWGMLPVQLDRFRERYLATGKRLDMGKSCVRFRKLEDLPLEVVGETIAATTIEGFLDKSSH